jgi:WD40 repeat protein
MRITLELPAPYIGLRPFFEADSLLFFGRDQQVAELLKRLEGRRGFISVLGASGCGKSSLIRAGLVPALHRGAMRPGVEGEQPPHLWNICVMQPGDAPLARLAQALTEDRRWRFHPDRDLSVAALRARFGSSPMALVELYRELADRFPGESLLVVVDQFEEVFRFRQRDPDEAEAFVKLLLRSAGEDMPIHVVTTMRSDFLGHCTAFHGLPETINDGLYLTPRLTPQQISQVIQSPLDLVGGAIDPVLANHLINLLGGDDELPILQHALLRMWRQAQADGRTTIALQDFETVCSSRPQEGPADDTGGVPARPQAAALFNAIDNHAAEIFDRLTEPQRVVARRCFLALVERRDGRDTRRPQAWRDLCGWFDADQGADLLAVADAFRAEDAGFLLPREGTPIVDDDMVDISHESLFRQWGRFKLWLDEEQADVAGLHEWLPRARRQVYQRGDFLEQDDYERARIWRDGVRLRGQPDTWAKRYEAGQAFADVDAYIEGSGERLTAKQMQIESDRQHRLQDAVDRQLAAEAARARTKVLSRWAIGGCFLAMACAAVAITMASKARDAKVDAEKLARKARAEELADRAEKLIRDKPDQALLLALVAREIASAPKADGILRGANQTFARNLVLVGHQASIRGASISRVDGRTTILSFGDDGTARLWNTETGREILVLKGHAGAIRGAQMSEDGRLVATAGADGKVRIWDAANGHERQILGGHEGAVLNVRFDAKASRLVSVGQDHSARIWKLTGGEFHFQRRIDAHHAPVRLGQFSPDGKTMLTFAQNAEEPPRLWDPETGRELAKMRWPKTHGRLQTAIVSPDWKWVLTAGSDGHARQWRMDNGQEVHQYIGHKGSIGIARLSDDGRRVLTTGADGSARIWEADTGAQLAELRGHDGTVISGRFSANGKTVVTVGADQTARIWDAETGQPKRILRGHNEAVINAVYLEKGRKLMTVGADSVRIWDLSDEMVAKELGPDPDPARRMAGLSMLARWTADVRLLMTPAEANSIRLWDAATGKALRTIADPQGTIADARLSSDGATVITATADGTVRLWNTTTGRSALEFTAHRSTVPKQASADLALVLSPDGRTAMTADDVQVLLWNTQDGSGVRRLTGHAGPIVRAEFSKDSRRVATASMDGTARIWQVDTGKELQVLSGHTDDVNSARFSPDGLSLLTASNDGTARIWALAGHAKLIHKLDGHGNHVGNASFSRDGRYVLTSGDDGTARIWDARTGRERFTLRGHEDAVNFADFSFDGRTVVTASEDQTARLWDTDSGVELAVLRGHRFPVAGCGFSKDDRNTIVTTDRGGYARVWQCEVCGPADAAALAVRNRIQRELTPDERERFGLGDAGPNPH